MPNSKARSRKSPTAAKRRTARTAPKRITAPQRTAAAVASVNGAVSTEHVRELLTQAAEEINALGGAVLGFGSKGLVWHVTHAIEKVGKVAKNLDGIDLLIGRAGDRADKRATKTAEE